MSKLELMCITNDCKLARQADKSGVDYIFVDLELLGKELRQGHLDTVISKHEIEDVGKIRKVVSNSKLLVRVNPINDGSLYEIESVISYGADVIMLPYFKSKEDVETIVKLVRGRVKIILLLENKEAVEDIDRIIDLKDSFEAIHIGLNDLHLSYKLNFMFEPFVNGIIDDLVNKFRSNDIKFGIGGVAEIGKGDIPAELVLNEHFKLGSRMCILSRSFSQRDKYDNEAEFLISYSKKVQGLRDYWNRIVDSKVNDDSVHFRKLVLNKVNQK